MLRRKESRVQGCRLTAGEAALGCRTRMTFWGVNIWAETRVVRNQPCGGQRQVAGLGGQQVSTSWGGAG